MTRLPRPISLCAAALLAASAARAADPAIRWDKVHSRVVTDATATGEAEFLIFLDEQADLAPVAALSTKEAKGRGVYARLTEVAARTQAPLLAWLDQRGVAHRSF